MIVFLIFYIYLFILYIIFKKFYNYYYKPTKFDLFGSFVQTKKYGFSYYSNLYIYLFCFVVVLYVVFCFTFRIFINLHYLDSNFIYIPHIKKFVFISTFIYLYLYVNFYLYLQKYFNFNLKKVFWLHIFINCMFLYTYGFTLYIYLLYTFCLMVLFILYSKKLIINETEVFYDKNLFLDWSFLYKNSFVNLDNIKNRFKL